MCGLGIPYLVVLHPQGNGAVSKSWNAGGMESLADYDVISPEERLRRIGRLLCKAAILALARREAEGNVTTNDLPAPDAAGDRTEATGGRPLEAEELELLRHARHLGGIAPREVSRFWKVSRATAYRRLSSLEKQGWIERKGATAATRYAVTRQTLDFLKKSDSSSGESLPSK